MMSIKHLRIVVPVFVLLATAALLFSSTSSTIGVTSFSLLLLSFQIPKGNLTPLPPPSLPSHQPSSCWSRHEQDSWRKNGPNAPSPSPKFLQAVRAYEALHARCTKDVADWTLHLAGDGNSNVGEPSYAGTRHEGCQYLVYRRGSGGLGNRLLSLSSAFLLSVLTQRALLIPLEEQDLRILCEPFQDSSWWADLNRDLLQTEQVTMEDFLKDLSGVRSVSINLDYDADSQASGTVYCDDVQLALRKVTWLSFQSDTWIGPSLHLSTVLRSAMVDLFPDNLAFPRVARYLLNPNNEIWDYVQRMYIAYFQSADRRVGIQIRTFSDEYHEEILERIVMCTKEGLGMPSPIDKATWEKLTSAESQDTFPIPIGKPPPRRIAFLITSLDIRYYKSFQEEYLSLPMSDGSIMTGHMFSFEGEERHDSDQERKAFSEMILLSLCDDLMISFGSTFGHIAAGLYGSPIWKLSIADRPTFKSFKDSHPICLLEPTEPCQTVIFQPHCPSESSSLLAVWPSHTTVCMEYEFGRQLSVPSQSPNITVW